MPETTTELSSMARGLGCTADLFHLFDHFQDFRRFNFVAPVLLHLPELNQKSLLFPFLFAADQITHHIALTGKAPGLPAGIKPAFLLLGQGNVQCDRHARIMPHCLILSTSANCGQLWVVYQFDCSGGLLPTCFVSIVVVFWRSQSAATEV